MSCSRAATSHRGTMSIGAELQFGRCRCAGASLCLVAAFTSDASCCKLATQEDQIRQRWPQSVLHVQTPGCLMHCSIAVAASGSPFLNTRQYIVLQFASSGFRLATFGDCIVATLACCCHCGLRFWSETYLHGLSTEISLSGILFERRNLSKGTPNAAVKI